MTRWVGDSGIGRPRGPVAILRAWVEVIARPWIFFRSNVAPGDQGPGLTFLAAVVAVEEAVRIFVIPGSYPVFGSQPALSAVVWLLVAVVIVAPLGTHLVAALQTILFAVGAPKRGGISETVQVLCYATAPCVIAGLPDPRIRLLVVGYGMVLYTLGMALVHELTLLRATVLSAVPAALVFGVGFRGLSAMLAVSRQILDWVATL